jgi:uncharacterized protein
MELLIQRFYEKYAQVDTKIIREFMHQVDWSNRFVGIKGGRGVGKTTLLLQYIRQNYELGNKVLYASLDHFYFSDNRLYDLANDFYKKGGELLVLDEVHRYPTWSTELKNIYDDFPGLKVIFTGSSLLHLQKATADLSRRAVMYSMPGLSLREFISIETGENLQVIKLEDLLRDHVGIAAGIIPKLKPLVYFDAYLNYGYYPFYLENKSAFHQKLNEIIQVVLDVDIPQYENLPSANIKILKKLLQVLAGSSPFKPNMQSISQRTGISVNTLKSYLAYLNNAQMISLLNTPEYGLSRLSKPEKIYLHNTNMMFSLAGDQWNKGNVRETYFLNQVSEKYPVYSSKETDFLVYEKYSFELGGKSKSKKQIKNLENAFVVKDGIEIGYGNIIPLWLFGFLY